MKPQIPYQSLEPARRILVVFFLFVAAWYLTWRLGTINKDALLFSWLLYCAELYGFFTTLMHIFMTWRLTERKAPVPVEGLTVDVFITTINEPVSLLRKTLLAASRMDYPHQTWLLDDGRRPEVESLANELGCRYLTRQDNSHAKAGNLNNALVHSTADFIAVFDADHAPKRNFLLQTLGYFQDQSVAYVQTPQDFYNLDSFQHHKKSGSSPAWHEQAVFFRVIQRGKDYQNSAFFCGSCAVIRRTSLDAIGGFAIGTVTEDLHTSVRLHKKGFRSVYHAESLAFGLAPSGVVPFLKQRIRWGQGAMQVWRKEGVFFCRGLTIAQRINYLASTITYFDGWQKGLFYIAPAIVLITGVMPLSAFGPDFLKHFIPYFILTFWVFEEVNRGYGRSLVIEQYNMSRFAAMAWSTLGFFKGKIKFRVTPKGTSPISEYRSYVIPQTLILACNALAIPIGLTLYFSHSHLPLNGVIANIIWASVNGFLAISILIFTAAHSRYRRSDYRFPLPLPAMIQFSDENKFYGTIDDISSAGFRMYAALPKDIPIDTQLTGEVYLPSGRVTCKAVVKSLIQGTSGKESYVKAIGCSFVWSDTCEQDKLDLFLYGSDMQWSLHSLREVVHTPLDWISRKLSGTGENPVQNPDFWNTIVYSPADKKELKAGLITSARNALQPRKLMAFSLIPEGTRLQVGIYSRLGISTITGTTGPSNRIDTPVAPLYICQFIQDETSNILPMSHYAPRKSFAAFLLTCFLFGSATSHAGDILVLGGVEGGGARSYNYYTFAAAVAPLFGGNLGNGFVHKYWIDFLGYNYPAGDRNVDATAIGLEGALGYQISGPISWGGAYAGVRYSNTWLSPDNPDSNVRGSQVRPKMQVEGETALASDWKLNGIASYVFVSNSYWSRGRVLYRVSGEIHTGPELIVHGDPDYRTWQWGWLISGFEPVPRASLGLKAGARKTEREDIGGYFGVEFSKIF